MSELDALLDLTLDDIEDLPSFEPFTPGYYKVGITLDTKEVNEHPSVEMELKLLEVIELVDNTAKPPAVGDTSSILFMLDNEFGLGKLKAAVVPIAEALGVASIREAVDNCKDVECAVALTARKDKNDTSKMYQGIAELKVL